MNLINPLFLATATVSFFFFGFAAGSFDAYKVRKEAIENGYALYCPDNGQWSWKGECDES